MNDNHLFRDTAVRPTFVFPGITPYVKQEAARLGVGSHHEGRVYSLWHVRQAQDALGQLPRLRATDRPELLRHIMAVRDGLALALAGLDAAISHVTTELGMVSPPEPDVVPPTKPKAREKCPSPETPT